LNQDNLFEKSWQRACIGLGLSSPAEGLRDELLARYNEPQRHYHTQQHLAECLQLVDDLHTVVAEVEMALWFHDAVYDLKAKDNEARSAQLALERLSALGVGNEQINNVQRLIMVTCHQNLPIAADEKLLVDIDLAILGAARPRFDEYETQVRAEYRYVPWFLYRHVRKKILRGFLARDTLYSTPSMVDQFEQQARVNLSRVCQ
jgi:predicted metal-dependent HD superfamily phosphohydrolase